MSENLEMTPVPGGVFSKHISEGGKRNQSYILYCLVTEMNLLGEEGGKRETASRSPTMLYTVEGKALARLLSVKNRKGEGCGSLGQGRVGSSVSPPIVGKHPRVRCAPRGLVWRPAHIGYEVTAGH